jgi:hypothetical protein
MFMGTLRTGFKNSVQGRKVPSGEMGSLASSGASEAKIAKDLVATSSRRKWQQQSMEGPGQQ